MDTLNADGTWDRLGSIALLLHQAATQVWSDADRSAADSPLHDLGLGEQLQRPDLVHGSQLVVDLCDLIREARGLGY